MSVFGVVRQSRDLVAATLESPRIRQIIRFAVIGTLTAIVYLLASMALHHLARLPMLAASTLGFVICVMFQYVGHAYFTFNQKAADAPQFGRFSVAIGVGFLISVLIVEALSPIGVPSIIIFFLICVLTALSNWLFFAFWVYAAGREGRGR